MRATVPLVAVGAVGAVALLVVLNQRPTGGDDVRVSFDEPSVDVITEVVVSGSAAVDGVVVPDGGAVRQVDGAPGEGSAAAFPARGQPAAVVVLRNAGATDRLAPGTGAFAFGADIRTDVEPDTDGDNIVQRGLWQDDGQYKLQLDYGTVSCTVAGTAGRVLVEVAEAIEPSVWYRVACERDGDTLRLTVERPDTGVVREATGSGPIGAVGMADASSPLSVGGKVGADGQVVEHPDQFNGAVDNVFVRID